MARIPARETARSASLCALMLALLAPAAGASRTFDSREWMPLKQGNRWTYFVAKERRYVHPSGAATIERFEGTSVDVVTRSLGPFAGAEHAFEVRSSGHGRDPASGREVSSVQTLVLSSQAGRVVLHTAELGGRPIQLLSPIVLLPSSSEPGTTWDVGEMIQDGLRFRMRGEVVGFEDVTTPVGDFENCLKLRYTADVTGGITIDRNTLRLEAGSLESLEWYAAGVGSVKGEDILRFTIRMPNGERMHAEETDERLLWGLELQPDGGPRVLPAAPAP